MPKKFYEKYTLVSRQEIFHDFLIDQFSAVNIADPFPYEKIIYKYKCESAKGEVLFNRPHRVEDLVYPESKINVEYFQPIYIPTKCIMFKMMRACISVECESELWFNKSENSEEPHQHDQVCEKIEENEEEKDEKEE